MKIGTIVTTNPKGQIVIPKAIRKRLGITSETTLNLVPRGNGVYLYPVEELLMKHDAENSYFDLLKKTQGGWTEENWKFLRSKRKRIELNASKKRKKTW